MTTPEDSNTSPLRHNERYESIRRLSDALAQLSLSHVVRLPSILLPLTCQARSKPWTLLARLRPLSPSGFSLTAPLAVADADNRNTALEVANLWNSHTVTPTISLLTNDESCFLRAQSFTQSPAELELISFVVSHLKIFVESLPDFRPDLFSPIGPRDFFRFDFLDRKGGALSQFVWAGDVAYSLSILSLSRDDYTRAGHRLLAARSFYQLSRSEEGTAECNHQIGNLAWILGAFEGAESHLNLAREYYRRHSELEEEMNCLADLGSVAISRGTYDKAREYSLVARDYFTGVERIADVARCERDLGAAYCALGSYELGRRFYLIAQRRYAEVGATADAATCTMNLGIVAFLEGDVLTGRRLEITALTFFEEEGLPRQAATCRQNLATLFAQIGDRNNARLFARSSRDYFAAEGITQQVAECNYLLGRLATADGDHEDARQYFSAARVYFEEAGITYQRNACDLELSHVYLAEGFLRDALTFAVRAAVGFDQLRYRLTRLVDRVRWRDQFGQSLFLALQLAHACGDFERVGDLVESARTQGVPTDNVDGSARDSRWSIGPLAYPPSRTSSYQSDRGAISAFGEIDSLGPPHGVRLGSDHSSLAESVGMTDAKEAVSVAEVAKAVGGDGAWWWGSWAVGGVLYWYVLGPTGELEAGQIRGELLDPLIARLTAGIPDSLSDEDEDTFAERMFESILASPDEAELARKLGQILIPDVLRRLMIETDLPISLVIAPAMHLAQIPFSWLAVDEDDTRVIERAAVRLGASVGLLHEALSRRPKVTTTGTIAVVDPGGPPLFPTKGRSVRRMAEDINAHRVERLITRSDHLNECEGIPTERATPAELVTILSSGCLNVLFFLGHAGRGKGHPARAHLLLDDGAVLEARLLYEGEPLMAQRVVLIACGSARHEGPEWLGLAPACLYAGAEVVVAALWDLLWYPDQLVSPTYDIALSILRAAVSGNDLAMSWRDLQLGYLARWRAGDPLAAPIYWAGIAAVGFSSRDTLDKPGPRTD